MAEPKTVTGSDGTKYVTADLVKDADGYWARMDGALALIKPSTAFDNARAAAEAQRQADEAVRAEAQAYEDAVQAEMRAMAEERIAERRALAK